MSDTTQGFSQFLSTYGPGAMLDLPDHAVIMSGLDDWPGSDQEARTIHELRLSRLIRQALPERFPHPPRLMTPPPHDSAARTRRPVPVRVFPQWFVANVLPDEAQDGAARETVRPMIEYDSVSEKGPRGMQHKFSEGTAKVGLNPVRFVASCPNGHLEDIDWRRAVHRRSGGQDCRQALSWVETGVSADPDAIRIRCACGAQVSLAELHIEGFLGTCTANHPWLTPRRQRGDECGESLRLLARSATNAYFPQTISLISLPAHADTLIDLLEGNWTTISKFLETPGRAGVVRTLLSPRLDHADDDEIDRAIGRVAAGDVADASSDDPRIEEFERLGARHGAIGQDGAASPLYGERLPRRDVEHRAVAARIIDEIVRVHRLREVACLYGFTRLEPAPNALESELEDITLATESAKLARDADWLPAVERFGEGVFLRFAPDAIVDWAQRARATGRLEALSTGEEADARKFGRTVKHQGAAYWAIHSLSHALMSDLSLRSGYPLSSLKERIYASPEGATRRYGLLIYTATAGGQGTLGGLSRAASMVPELLDTVATRLEVCSNDPVCRDHRPDAAHDDRPLQGAACHACLLVPETSCEARNGRLDRELLVNEDGWGLLQPRD